MDPENLRAFVRLRPIPASHSINFLVKTQNCITLSQEYDEEEPRSKVFKNFIDYFLSFVSLRNIHCNY